jgi:flavodoxin
MRTLVVYDSLYGNTEAIAQAVAAVLPGEVQLRRVTEVDPGEVQAVDLLIVGSPTHGALASEAARALLDRLGAPAQEGARAATFDTRLTWPFLERWGGFAAPKMADVLKDKGWTLVGQPGGFFVKGLKKGPLKRGEESRAAAWARGLAGTQAAV